jgi:predicted RND superfamily exporter protein
MKHKAKHKALKTTKKKFFRFLRKHTQTVMLIELIATLLSTLYGEKVVLIQRIIMKELPIAYEHHATIEETVKVTLGVASSVHIFIETPNGIIEHVAS